MSLISFKKTLKADNPKDALRAKALVLLDMFRVNGFSRSVAFSELEKGLRSMSDDEARRALEVLRS